MAFRTLMSFDEQTGITGMSDTIITNPLRELAVAFQPSAGSGRGKPSASVLITLDDPSAIRSGTAAWVASPQSPHAAAGSEKLPRPVTGVQLAAKKGVWRFQVRQA